MLARTAPGSASRRRHQLVAQALELGVRGSRACFDQRVRAEAAVSDADAVLGAQDRGEQRVPVALEVERHDADASTPLRARARGSRAPAPPRVRPEALRPGPLVLGDGIHAERSSLRQAAPSATTPTTFGEPASWRSARPPRPRRRASRARSRRRPAAAAVRAEPRRGRRSARRRRTARRACGPRARGSRRPPRPCRAGGAARAGQRRRTAARRAVRRLGEPRERPDLAGHVRRAGDRDEVDRRPRAAQRALRASQSSSAEAVKAAAGRHGAATAAGSRDARPG